MLSVFLVGCTPPVKHVALPNSAESKLGFDADIYLSELPNNAQIAIRIWDKNGTKRIDLERKQDQWSEVDLSETTFGLGPMSQLFTADIAVDIMKQGLFASDQKLSTIGLETNPSSPCLQDIKIIHLLNHSSGLPNLPGNMTKDVIINKSNPYAGYESDRLSEFIKEKADCTFIPGKKYQYSLVGYAFLGQLMEALSQKNYTTLLNEYVINPSQLQNTGLITLESPLNPGINESGDAVENWTYTSMSPAAGAYTSPADMIKWIKQLDARQSPPQLNPTMIKPDSSGVALGWHFKTIDNNRIYYMSGATGGFTSTLRWDRDNGRGILIMTNVSALVKRAAVIENLADRFMNDSFVKF